MNLSNIFKFFALVFFTILFVNDFFPNTTLHDIFSQKIVLLILVILIILGIMTSANNVKKMSKKRYNALTIYAISLWIILTFLGGDSQTGLSLNEPLFFVVVVLLGFDLYRVNRKPKEEEKK